MWNAIASGVKGLAVPLLTELGSMGSQAVLKYAGRRLGELGNDSSTPKTLGEVTQKTVDTMANNTDLQRRIMKLQKRVRSIRRSMSAPKRVTVAPVAAPAQTMTNDNELGFEDQ